MGAKSEVSPTPVLSKTGWPLGVWAAIGKVMPAAASRSPGARVRTCMEEFLKVDDIRAAET